MSISPHSPSLLFSRPFSPSSSASGSEIPTPRGEHPSSTSSPPSSSDEYQHHPHLLSHRVPSPLDLLVAVSSASLKMASTSSSSSSSSPAVRINSFVVPDAASSLSSLPAGTLNPPAAPTTTVSVEVQSSKTRADQGPRRRVSTAGSGSGGGGSPDDEDEDQKEEVELTSKGKKRKRLARACTACHKNKRRCTGELPCSNCEFSGRECTYLSSKGEPVPAPRASRPRSNSNLSVASSSGRSRADSLASAFGSTRLNPPRDPASSPHQSSSSLLAVPSRQATAFSMGASSLGEGFYGGPKSGGSSRFGVATTASPVSVMRGIREGEVEQQTSWSRSELSLSPRYPPMFSSSTLPSPPTPSSFSSPRLPQHPASAPEPLDPLLKRSLLHLFFANLSDPLCSIFHRPTFFASVYEGRTSSLLLNSIYAWSARFSTHEMFDPSSERSTRGEVFADEVRKVVESREWQEEAASGGRCSEQEEIEKAQALVLLVMYESLVRRGERTSIYLDILIPLITRLTRQDNPPPPLSRLSPPSLAELTSRETRSRIFWLTYVLSTFADAQLGRSGSSTAFSSQDCRLALPVEDGRFEMGACGEGLGADTLTHQHESSKSLVSELGHLARVARVFREVVGSPSSGSPSPSRNQEAALKAWATGLPPSLQFDETNLSGAVERILGTSEDTKGGPSAGGERGHGFATIHTTAEVCMFFHISSVRNAGMLDPAHEEFLISRQSQAVENIVFVLNAIGEKGRRNPFMFFPLLIVSQWRTSTSSSLPDPRPATWSSEMLSLWGISPSSSPSSPSPSFSPSGLSSKFSPFSIRSPTLSDLPSPSLLHPAHNPTTRLPSISSLTGGPSLGGRDRSNSASSSAQPMFSVPMLPRRSDSFSLSSTPFGSAGGSPLTLPVPVSPAWSFGAGAGSTYFESAGASPSPRLSWGDGGLVGKKAEVVHVEEAEKMEESR